MANKTNIAWTDATFNPWIGCTEISTAESGGGGCDDCYARALDNRHRWGGATHWGAGVPRMRTSEGNWKKPLVWNRHAENGLLPDGKTPSHGRSPRVFCASLADVFDNEVPQEWREQLWNLIATTQNLTWLLLTKRIGYAARMLPWLGASPYPNVWVGATIVNQKEADRDAPKLLRVPATKRFVSYEPALGPVDWSKFPGIDWIIVGGASRQKNRAPEFDIENARRTVSQCRVIGAAPFVKQLGSAPQEISYPGGVSDAEKLRWQRDGWTQIHILDSAHWRKYLKLKDRAGADPAEWPEDLRVREFPA